MSHERAARPLALECLGFAVLGVAVALWGEGPLFAPYNAAMHTHFWPLDPPPPSALEVVRWLEGPLGATITGKYLALAMVAAVPLRRREAWAWHALLWSQLVWFALDSGVSAGHGAYFNIWMINLVPMVAMALPLWWTRPSHRQAA